MLTTIYNAIRKYLYRIVLFIGLAFCLCWSLSPLRDKLKSWHWIDDQTVFGVMGVMVAITILELQHNEKGLSKLESAVGQLSPAQVSTIEFGGVGAVYAKFNPAVKQMVSDCKRATTIDILGLTLFSAWPVSVEPYIQSGDIRKCTVNLYMLNPEFLIAHNTFLKQDWAQQAASKRSEIACFLKEQEQHLLRNQVSVNLKPYAFFPGVHGFRTSEGHLMLSFVQWSNIQKTIENPNQFYEIFMPSDTSPRANAYRNLFDNWISRAARD